MATVHVAGIWPCARFSQNPIKRTDTRLDAHAGIISQANVECDESFKVDCTTDLIFAFYENITERVSWQGRNIFIKIQSYLKNKYGECISNVGGRNH